MRCLRIAALSAAALFTASGIAQAQTPKESPQLANEGWRTEIYPLFGWLPMFKAKAILPDQPGSGGDPIVSPETSGTFEGAAAAGFRLERHRFSVQAQLLWAGMSGSVTTPSFDLTADTIYGQVTGGVQIVPALYIDGGVRRIAVDMTATLLAYEPVKWKPGVWESVLGATYRPAFGKHVRLLSHVDVGGLEDSEHRTAAVTAIVEWKPVSHFAIGGGWSFLHLRKDGTILSKPVSFQQTLNGPMLTLGIPF